MPQQAVCGASTSAQVAVNPPESGSSGQNVPITYITGTLLLDHGTEKKMGTNEPDGSSMMIAKAIIIVAFFWISMCLTLIMFIAEGHLTVWMIVVQIPFIIGTLIVLFIPRRSE
jgi:hypothetical protein